MRFTNTQTVKQFTTSLTVGLLSATLFACGGGAGDSADTTGGNANGGTSSSGGGSTAGSSDPVEKVLNDLGIDTTVSRRVDNDGDDLPEDYAPLGSRTAVNKFAEIVLVGVEADDTNVSTAGNLMTVTNLVPISGNRFDWEVLHDEPAANTPWIRPLNAGIARASVEGDFDGDGIDEIFMVYQLDNDDVKFVLVQDASQNFVMSDAVTVNNASWSRLFASAGDFDGDGREDVMIGLTSFTGGSRLLMLKNDNGILTLNGQGIDIEKRLYDNSQLSMVSGNIDYDKAHELVVTVNEGQGQSEYYVFDDATENFRVLQNAQLSVANGSGTSQAVVTNVALGDVDGDSIDEIILAGLDEVGKIFSSDTRDKFYLIKVLDDAKQNLLPLAEQYIASGAIKLKYSAATQILDYVQVISADIDGDGAKEIVVNQYVFNSLRTSPDALVLHDEDGDASNGVTEIPLENWTAIKEQSYHFDWSTSAIAAADVTLDKRENIVIYSERNAGTLRGAPQQELQVWGLDQVNGWSKMAAYQTARKNSVNFSEKVQPTILLPDLELDDGSATLVFSEGSHRLVFTQPVILAALAAAPCATDLGQDLGESCRTAFGTAVSSSNSRTDGWTFTSGGSVGFDGKVPFTNSGLEVTASAQETLRNWTTTAYTLKKTVTRETGALEDSVILTSVPMDVYFYTVLSHPDANLVGQTVQVRLPREMITTMVTRDFYNQVISEGGPKIDEQVFQHTEGDPQSYPDRFEKGQLLSRYDGLQSAEFTTGQGLGQTIATISEFTSTTNGNSYEFEASLDVQATTGVVMGGFNIGKGSDKAIEVTRGTENIYQGSVGNISATAFQQGLDYNWGLFSYFYQDSASGQTFEVLNYWVN
jgi:hypothetical protein